MADIRKFPRTRHIDGSGLQSGDDPGCAGWDELAGRLLVVEEKVDGANCGLSFDDSGQLTLQSRGHFLTGGRGERQFDLLKSWARRHEGELRNVLGQRYVVYGEWCFARHTIFYTDLPHYLLEFDILDTETEMFLSTSARRTLLAQLPFIVSVEVLYQGTLSSLEELRGLMARSRFIAADHRLQLAAAAQAAGLGAEAILAQSDPSGLMEGLYVKTEERDSVTGRYKYVRPGFLQTVIDSGSHWNDRPLLPNRLRPGVTLW